MPVMMVTIVVSYFPAIQRMEETWRHSDSQLLLMITSLMFKSAIATWSLA
jgi:hypothetical protein